MRRCAKVSDVYDVLSESAIASISLLVFLVPRYVVTVIMCMRSVYLMHGRFCVLMFVVYFLFECIFLSGCCMFCNRIE